MRAPLSRHLRHCARIGLALSLTATSALATWSIVVVDTQTGEVAVGCASCVGVNLQKLVPVIVPGIGAAACQSNPDLLFKARPILWEGLQRGVSPQELLERVIEADGVPQTRQYGIANLADAPVTFTGLFAGQAKPGLIGAHGSLRYAIQGNVLACDQVVYAAETALVTTNGDLSQRVLAAMLAARDFGGDGRCSCAPNDPTGCGCPPPGFTSSSLEGFMIVARIGDALGDCTKTFGCSTGQYFCEIKGGAGPPGVDPVDVIAAGYQVWRQGQLGLVDQVNTAVTASASSLPADGVSTLTVDIRAVDIDGTPIAHGGLALQLVSLSAGPTVTSVGAIVDHGDGTYSIPLTAGASAGRDRWRVLATENGKTIALQPDIDVRVDPKARLHAGRDVLAAQAGGSVPFVIDLGAPLSGKGYFLLGSASGTYPGTLFEGALLPLNSDAFLRFTLSGANGPSLPVSQGQLDPAGRATPGFVAAPGTLAPYVGLKLYWAARIFAQVPTFVGPVALDVLP